MGIDYRWVVDDVTGRYRWVSYTGRQVVDEVTDGYRWVSYASRRNRHVVNFAHLFHDIITNHTISHIR